MPYRVEQGLVGHSLLECFGFELFEIAFEYFDVDRFSFGIFVTHSGTGATQILRKPYKQKHCNYCRFSIYGFGYFLGRIEQKGVHNE